MISKLGRDCILKTMVGTTKRRLASTGQTANTQSERISFADSLNYAQPRPINKLLELPGMSLGLRTAIFWDRGRPARNEREARTKL